MIAKLTDLKHTYREDIRDRVALEQNFREKFDALNRVNLTDSEFARLRDEIVNPDVFTADGKPSKQKMTRQQLIDLISASANLMDERDDIVGYINSLQAGESLNEKAIRKGYNKFKAEKSAKELTFIAKKMGLRVKPCKALSTAFWAA